MPARLSTRTGKTGGRTESGFHLKRNSVAGPHILPWQGPMPQRVYSFAARHDECPLRRECETSSHRQTIVSAEDRFFNSGRRRKVRSRIRAKRRPFRRAPNNFRASSVCPAAARPAICPSMSDNSKPPILVGSPAQKIPLTVVCCKSSTCTNPLRIWHASNCGNSVLGIR